jgi:hypothetical protein
MKRSALGSFQFFFCGGVTANDTDQFFVYFRSVDTLAVTSGVTVFRETSQVFRDTSAFFHLLIAVDTTQATANDRIKIYVNGSQVTAFSTTNNPAQNADTGINTATIHTLGRNSVTPEYYFNGYFADVHFINGQALDPSSFAETDATTGQWIPKLYSGSYGSNGFKLSFSDNSTTAALGTDTSGNGNTWTTNNFSVTAGSGNDSLVDTPTSYGTNTGVGGEVRGNYATLNPLYVTSTTPVLSNGNLDYSMASADGTGLSGRIATIASLATGKWYFEVTKNSGTGDFFFGWANPSWNPTINPDGNSSIWALRGASEVYKVNGGTNTQIFSSYADNDVFMIAVDIDAAKIWLGKNGTWAESGAPASGTNAQFTNLTGSPYSPFVRGAGGGGGISFSCNFGQRAFAYTAPSGFKALVDTNLPAPVVAKPDEVFQTVLYTGNGASRSITGLNFAPDFLWIKNRNSSGYNHHLTDAVRGVTQRLRSNTTGAELTSTDQVTAYNSNGFSLGADSAGPGDLEVNQNTGSYVAWAWDAGTNTVTNNSGSVSAQVRANASTGFSVCTFAQPSSSSSFSWGHGLNVAPQLAIMKPRDSSGNWQVYHASTGAQYIWLNSTNAAAGTGWSTVNSSIVTSTATLWQGSNVTTVAYCFSPVSGYSSFGSYTGNGSATDNTFVYTGMRPRFVMLKRSDSTGNWVIWDAVRNSYNVANSIILPNTSAAEYSPDAKIDILSNGFKVRDNSSDSGSSGGTYIFAAFAESPFQYARAR